MFFVVLLMAAAGVFQEPSKRELIERRDDTTELRIQCCLLVDDLQRLLKNRDFKANGFAGSGSEWPGMVETTFESAGNVHIEDLDIVSSLILIGKEYSTQGIETDFGRDRLKQVKERLEYESYLAQRELMKTRTWRDESGKHETRGIFVKLLDSHVIIKKTSDEVIEVPLEKLSKKDRELISNAKRFREKIEEMITKERP